MSDTKNFIRKDNQLEQYLNFYLIKLTKTK